MAKSYIKEIGDKLSRGKAATEGDHIKTIAPVYYRPADDSPDSAVVTIQSTINKVKLTDKSSDTGSYPLVVAAVASPVSSTAYEGYYDTGVKLTPSSNTISVNISGNAATATDLAANSVLSVGKGGTGKTSVTSNSFLVGNGSSAMVEKTPAEVLALIGAQATITYMTSSQEDSIITELGDL